MNNGIDVGWLHPLFLNAAEAGLLFDEEEFDLADRAVAVFADQHVDDIFPLGVGVIVVVTVEKHHDIGVLFDRTRIT